MMTKPAIHISSSDLETVVGLMQALPEFSEPHDLETIRKRIEGVPHLSLVAFVEENPAGFKLGYEREGFFYSWLGGVLPAYRRLGIARALADEQERWAAARGYDAVYFKTRNRHRAMLIFALKNGFDIIGFEEKPTVQEHRIWLRKSLSLP